MDTIISPQSRDAANWLIRLQTLMDTYNPKPPTRYTDRSIFSSCVLTRPLLSVYFAEGHLHLLWGDRDLPVYMIAYNGTPSLGESIRFGMHPDKLILDPLLGLLKGLSVSPYPLLLTDYTSGRIQGVARMVGELHDLQTLLDTLDPVNATGSFPTSPLFRIIRFDKEYQLTFQDEAKRQYVSLGASDWKLQEYPSQVGPGGFNLTDLIPHLKINIGSVGTIVIPPVGLSTEDLEWELIERVRTVRVAMPRSGVSPYRLVSILHRDDIFRLYYLFRRTMQLAVMELHRDKLVGLVWVDQVVSFDETQKGVSNLDSSISAVISWY